MSNVIGTVTIGGTSPLTTGITQTSRDNAITGINSKTTDILFQNAVMGVSVTRFDETDTQSWAIEVRSAIGGFNFQVAGVTGIGSTTSALMPIYTPQDTVGTTGTEWVGIPRPTTVDVVGSSTAVGTTFGCVITMHLYNPS